MWRSPNAKNWLASAEPLGAIVKFTVPSRSSSMRSASKAPSGPRTVSSSRWPRASLAGTLDRTVSLAPIPPSNASTTLAPASPSMTRPSIRPDNRAPSSPISMLSSASASSASPRSETSNRASPAESDSVATMRSGSTRTSSALKPGSCAAVDAWKPNARAAVSRTTALLVG